MKRGITLLVCLVMIGGLLGLLFYLDNRPTSEEDPFDNMDELAVTLIDRERWEIKSIRLCLMIVI